MCTQVHASIVNVNAITRRNEFERKSVISFVIRDTIERIARIAHRIVVGFFAKSLQRGGAARGFVVVYNNTNNNEQSMIIIVGFVCVCVFAAVYREIKERDLCVAHKRKHTIQ